jgi:hypothetical protein
LLACGKAASNESTGSETHWVQRCEADVDCAVLGDGVGCRNGWCSADVEVASTNDSANTDNEAAPTKDRASGVAMNAGGGHASGTDQEADGVGAERNASEADVFAGSSDAQLASELCDGSEGPRLIYRSSLGYADDPFWSAAGPSHYIVDGQCRFWGTLSDSGAVFTRQLDEGVAARLARAVRFGRQTPWSDGGAPCADLSDNVLWTPQARVDCRCNCFEREGVPTWNETFETLAVEPVTGNIGLFEDSEPMTGPARLLLYRVQSLDGSRAEPWPLARPPAESELARVEGYGGWGEDWGVLISDPVELELLRKARSIANPLDVRYTPLLWTRDDVTEELQMRLLDELPSDLVTEVRRKLAE